VEVIFSSESKLNLKGDLDQCNWQQTSKAECHFDPHLQKKMKYVFTEFREKSFMIQSNLMFITDGLNEDSHFQNELTKRGMKEK